VLGKIFHRHFQCESWTAYIAQNACGIGGALHTTELDVEEDTAVGAMHGARKYDMTMEILRSTEAVHELHAVSEKPIEQRHERKSVNQRVNLVAQGICKDALLYGWWTRATCNRKQLRCWFCGEKGHLEAECRKRLRDEKSSVAAVSAATYAITPRAGLSESIALPDVCHGVSLGMCRTLEPWIDT
jgi:hypothetical protein